MHISRLTNYSEETFIAVSNLLKQLSDQPKTFSENDFKEMLSKEDCYFLLAFENEQNQNIMGMLTLNLYHIPSGLQGHIDDLVVDNTKRGFGIGKALTEEAIQISKEQSAVAVTLTCHPRREAANQLYQKIGFKAHATNFYLMKLR